MAINKVNKRASWAAANPVLIAGEIGLESDTGNQKVGDGRTPWVRLPYTGSPGYWGSFWDLTSQVAGAINTPTAIQLRSSDQANRGVSIVSGSRITLEHPGVYSMTYSVQLANTDSQIHDIEIWLRKNDSGDTGNVPASNSRFSVTESHGGIDGHVIGTVNYVQQAAAGDYFELMWATSNVEAFILANAATTSPLVAPAIPGIICTVVQVASA
jgi:hypothetical protein